MSRRTTSSKRGRLVILSGPSGAGKTTLHDRLLQSPRFAERLVRSVSATTRAPRSGERHGRDYFFVSDAMFASKVRRGHFLEWAKVFDRCYGTPAKAVRDQLNVGRSVLLCIDVQGARQVRERMPDALTVFVRTVDMDELRRRLERRGTDAPETVALRLNTAAAELAEAARYDYVIVNDTLDRAFEELSGVLDRELPPAPAGRVR